VLELPCAFYCPLVTVVDACGCSISRAAASPTRGVRRLLIKVDRIGGSPASLTALLAHELQHACEVAAAPAIVDLQSFQKAFEKRGWKGTDGFETQEAREVPRRVLTEFADRRASSSPR
jgi:hypothetical protein